MRIVSVVFRAHGHAPAPTGIGPLLHDLLWAHAVPAAGLEHVRVRPVRAGLEAVFFVRAASDAEAVTGVRHLLDRVREPVTAHGYAAVRPRLAELRTDSGT
ncbi:MULTISPECIES: hypothetical protein [unclassified Streptomyces]|uniref:hypothetical protein n=1 Tax=unclassified Streptomyces TaxID=2593676 RepID=UPI0033D9D770